MRTLPGPLTTALATDHAEIPVVKIDWAAGASPRWYSDQRITFPSGTPLEIMPLVSRWGSLNQQVRNGFGQVSAWRLTLTADPFIAEAVGGAYDLIRTRVTLYMLAYPVGAPADTFVNLSVALFVGSIRGPVIRKGETVELTIVDFAEDYRQQLPQTITATQFANAPSDSLGLAKPIIYGSVPAVPCIRITSAAKSTIDGTFLQGATSFIVADATDFNALSTPFTVMVDDEEIIVATVTLATRVLSGLTRGANSTATQDHLHGREVIEKTGATYLVAGHAVTTLTNTQSESKEPLTGLTLNTANASFPPGLVATVASSNPIRALAPTGSVAFIDIVPDTTDAANAAQSPELARDDPKTVTFATLNNGLTPLVLSRQNTFDQPPSEPRKAWAGVELFNRDGLALAGEYVLEVLDASDVVQGSALNLYDVNAGEAVPAEDTFFQNIVQHGSLASLTGAHTHDIIEPNAGAGSNHPLPQIVTPVLPDSESGNAFSSSDPFTMKRFTTPVHNTADSIQVNLARLALTITSTPLGFEPFGIFRLHYSLPNRPFLTVDSVNGVVTLNATFDVTGSFNTFASFLNPLNTFQFWVENILTSNVTVTDRAAAWELTLAPQSTALAPTNVTAQNLSNETIPARTSTPNFLDITSLVAGNWSWFTGKKLRVRKTGGADRRLDVLHLFFAVSYDERELREIETLHVDVGGMDDNHNGTGALIDNPAFVISDILTEQLGVPSGEVDTGVGSTFQAAADALFVGIGGGGQYRFALRLADQRDSRTLLGDLAEQCLCGLFTSGGQFKLKVLSGTLPAADLTLASARAIRDGATELEQSSADTIIARQEAFYAEDYLASGAEPFQFTAFEDATALAKWGQPAVPAPRRLTAIQSANSALTWVTQQVTEHSEPEWSYQGEHFMHASLALEPLDVLKITSSVAGFYRHALRVTRMDLLFGSATRHAAYRIAGSVPSWLDTRVLFGHHRAVAITYSGNLVLVIDDTPVLVCEGSTGDVVLAGSVFTGESLLGPGVAPPGGFDVKNGRFTFAMDAVTTGGVRGVISLLQVDTAGNAYLRAYEELLTLKTGGPQYGLRQGPVSMPGAPTPAAGFDGRFLTPPVTLGQGIGVYANVAGVRLMELDAIEDSDLGYGAIVMLSGVIRETEDLSGFMPA